jgi:putative glutamine amidotransferase
MTPGDTSGSTSSRPRVGIPWRTSQEERVGERGKLNHYFDAVRKAGGEPVEISLCQQPGQLELQLAGFHAFVLPGSPADVDPARYEAAKHPKTKQIDENRDATDSAVLRHAFAASKPVLAICYGCQLLNVYLQGSLIQDLGSERPEAGVHGTTDLPPGAPRGDVQHAARFLEGGRLGRLSQATEATINSSHHQAIDRPGKQLRVTAKATDGTIEGVEWTGGTNWVVGVQWHPERMVGDAFAERLFADFVNAAREYSHSADGPVVEKA